MRLFYLQPDFERAARSLSDAERIDAASFIKSFLFLTGIQSRRLQASSFTSSNMADPSPSVVMDQHVLQTRVILLHYCQQNPKVKDLICGVGLARRLVGVSLGHTFCLII